MSKHKYDSLAIPERNGPWLALDYPIRPDFMAQVVVPRNLTMAEARRLEAFIMSLAIDEEMPE